MEFLIGLSTGMHLGHIIRPHLEDFFCYLGLLTPTQIQKIDQINAIEDDISSIVGELASIKEIKNSSNFKPVIFKKYFNPASINRR